MRVDDTTTGAAKWIPMHSEVLILLDAHLATLTGLRQELASARQVHHEERRRSATATIQSAQWYAQTVGRLLDGERVPVTTAGRPAVVE